MNINVTSAGDGSSWNTAFDNVQDALESALIGGEIWVAQGAYYPDIGLNQVDNDVASTFTIKEGIKLYGGFDGTEINISQRNPEVNLTILSGVLNGDDSVDVSGITASYTYLIGNNDCTRISVSI